MLLLAALACTLTVTDGDTLRCGEERIRLIGIDAPELPGHCRRGRICAPGDPWASKRSLEGAIHGRVTIRRFGTDRYGRTLAMVSVNGRDLSCHQLATGSAIYVSRWDNGGVVAAACPNLAR
jgi:micrococcal nuclease